MNFSTETYDEVRRDLIAFEKTHHKTRSRRHEVQKKAFKANQEGKREEVIGEDQIALVTLSVMESFRKSRNNRRGRNFGRGNFITDQPKNDEKCYECGKYRHIASECNEPKKNYSTGHQKNMALRSWSDEDNSKNENKEIGNIFFMTVGESSTMVCKNCTGSKKFVRS
ncbi:hypothetical protein H5410_046368 [Solanum commersonii]|uniref:CCHC-type domain-containing protein n=1 Tax=Solanum commersonii TaxID=4109 RepID=A0A9J5XFH2_SOLCO|nr:hypothetical protein H5410_046368 [Solanum commersonii]